MQQYADIYHLHHHHHHVPEGLGVFPVPWSWRWSWSLHLFLGRPMFLRPFDLYCSACFGSLFVSILCTCCSHFFWYCFISFTMFCTPIFCLIHWYSIYFGRPSRPSSGVHKTVVAASGTDHTVRGARFLKRDAMLCHLSRFWRIVVPTTSLSSSLRTAAWFWGPILPSPSVHSCPWSTAWPWRQRHYGPSETKYQITQCHSTQDFNLQQYCHDNQISPALL